MTNKYYLIPTVALMLASCSQTDEPGTVSEPKAASFSAQIGNTASRAAGTEWSVGDAIGIFGVSGTKAYDNLKFATESGDGNFAAAGENIFYQTTDDVTFTAYYPYRASLDAEGIITASTADQSNQPTFDFLWSQAKGSYAAPDVNFNFAHRMAQLNFVFANGNDVDLSDLTFSIDGIVLDGTFDTATGEAKITEGGTSATLTATVSDAKASMIVFPQNVETMTVNATVDGQQYVCTLNPGELTAGTSRNVNIAVKKTGMTVTGSTITDWTASGDFSGTATMPVPEPPHKGDFFYSDGTYSTELDASKTCIGIVFWTPEEATYLPEADRSAIMDADKIRVADFPDCTHGLVVALDDADRCRWKTDRESGVYDNFQNTYSFSAANKKDYKPIMCERYESNGIGYILGYQNTQILRAFYNWNESNGSRDNAEIIKALESYSSNTLAPSNTTGWYIPSYKELFLLMHKDVNDAYNYYGGDGTLSLINTKLQEASGTLLPSFIWSSTEALTFGSGSDHIEIIYSAYILENLSDTYNMIETESQDYFNYLRPVLAF